MTGLPTVQMLLDDGSGTYPIDITASVRMVDGVSISGFGRTDEFDQPQSATLTFVVDNETGSFTGHGTGFGVGGFGSGPFGGGVSIVPGTGVRLVLTKGSTTVNRFTGTVQTLGLGWPGGGDEFSTVVVTCADLLADLSRRPMRSMLEEEILLDSPTAYYTLGEAEGSTSAGDISNYQAPPLTPSGSGAAITFGSGTGPADGMTTATFAGGQTLVNSLSPGASYSMLVAFSRSGAPAAQEILLATARQFLVLETTGKVSLYSGLGVANFLLTPVATSSSSVCDGQVHEAGWSVAAGVGFQLFSDGVTTTVADVTAGTTGYVVAGLHVGGSDVTAGTQLLNANVSHIALFDGVALTSTVVASIWSAVSGFTGDATDARLARIAAYAGLASTTTGGSGQIMGTQSTSGSSLFDAMQAVATAEGGVLFADGSGAITMQGRNYRGVKTSPDLALTADAVGGDTSVTWDTQQKINQVSVTRTGGAEQVVQTDGVSRRIEPVYPTSLDLAVATDDDALGAAQWTLAKHQDTAPRLATATFDLLTSSAADAEALLGAGVGDRLGLTPMPSQMWDSDGYTVEGWSETISDSEWSMTVNLLPWDLFEAFILDDPTYGLLDSAVPIGY